MQLTITGGGGQVEIDVVVIVVELRADFVEAHTEEGTDAEEERDQAEEDGREVGDLLRVDLRGGDGRGVVDDRLNLVRMLEKRAIVCGNLGAGTLRYKSRDRGSNSRVKHFYLKNARVRS